MFPYYPKISIGLEIHSTELRLLQLRHRRAYHSVEKFATIKLPSGTIVEGLIKEKSILKCALTRLIEETNTRGQKAAITLPSQNIIITRIKLPNLLSEKELETEIKINLTRFFPGIPHTLCFDFVKIGMDNEYFDILLVATRSQLLTDYVESVESAGIKVKAVDSGLLALIRVTQQMHSPNDFIGILDLNTNSAQFIITHNKKFLCNQHFLISDIKDFVFQLKMIIQKILTVYHESVLQHFYYVGENVIEKFEQMIATAFNVTFLSNKIFINSHKSKQINVEQLLASSHQLMVCMGLALRAKKNVRN